MPESYGYVPSSRQERVDLQEDNGRLLKTIYESIEARGMSETVGLLNSGKLLRDVTPDLTALSLKERIRRLVGSARAILRFQHSKVPAIVYARHSSAAQNEPSVDRQVDLCRQHCEAQGYAEVLVCCDVAKTGQSLASRAGWSRVERALEAGAALIVVVESMDRITRNHFDLLAILDSVRARGAKIEIVTHDGGSRSSGLTPKASFKFIRLFMQRVRERHHG
jgi:predicted site-specific integrase-resolvase